ncbi:regulator of competence-specific genes [Cricetibacter osteomyelitidis]|uniref:Regulator of competence-specific genes n=1 Tax=Cricetibacter osteomyelitidis TaxID=1521931 RepID=A0A4R2TQP2_9PAST|nr:TfoX/Sxy family protein [Cricetibacter osteomyelitidis]TCP97332.1 regulator of competence-specific genes [Cricetibacter osteomyelitidis]
MMKEILDLQNELTELLGPITVKKLFTGYGFFSEEHMFGIWCNGHFYVRAENDLADYLCSMGATHWIEDCKMKLAISHYYLILDDLKTDKDNYQKLLISSIQQIKSNKTKFIMKNTERIRNLPNLSLKHERLLGKINIHSASELYIVGAEVAFARLKKYYASNITLNIYWALLGALKRKYVDTLTQVEKMNALTKLNKVLANMGLKEININYYIN